MIQLTQQEAEYILEQLNHVALYHIRAFTAVDDKFLDAVHNLEVKVNPKNFERDHYFYEYTIDEKPNTDAKLSA